MLGNLLNMDATASSPTSIFWRSCAPPRVQFFTWLLVHEWIQCKATLARRMILLDSTCELCGDGPETAVNLLFHCDFAASFWRALGFAVPTDLEARHIQQLPRPHMWKVATTTLSSSFVAGNYGNAGMESSSARRPCRYIRPCTRADGKPNHGAAACHVLSDA